jgi:WD40 repeat protein
MTGPIMALAFTRSAHFLGVAGDDDYAHILDLASCQEIGRIRHTQQIYDLAFSPDDTLLVTGSGEECVRVLRWQSAEVAAEGCSRVQTILGTESPEAGADLMRRFNQVCPEVKPLRTAN